MRREQDCTYPGEEVAIGDTGLLFWAVLLLASSGSMGQYLTRAIQVDKAPSALELSLVSAMTSSVVMVGTKRKRI